MDQLEFALIPIGIVLGYGVTKVIGSWAYAIQGWDRYERAPVLYFSSTALSLFFMYWNFSGLWEYKSVDFEGARGGFNVTYLFLITLPILLLMLSVSTLIPSDIDSINDLDAHYLDASRVFHLIFVLGIGSSFLPDLLPGISYSAGTAGFIIFIVFIVIFLIMGMVKSRVVHIYMQALLWIMLMAISFTFY